MHTPPIEHTYSSHKKHAQWGLNNTQQMWNHTTKWGVVGMPGVNSPDTDCLGSTFMHSAITVHTSMAPAELF